jgi:5-methylcytosine-specific restriction endonuclease McrA
VVSLKTYVRPARNPAFTRFNLFLRDRFECQYCGFDEDLTFDHVIPRSLGGKTTWENVVTACAPCNLRKGDRLPEEASMTLRRPPRPPAPALFITLATPAGLPTTWQRYLPGSTATA